MTQYLNKDDLVAEIERRRKLVSDPILSGDDLMIGERNALFNLLSFIDTLDVKDVDVENAAIAEWNDYVKKVDGDTDYAYMLIKREDYIVLAKHFFELGLKAKQTSEDIKIGETQNS